MTITQTGSFLEIDNDSTPSIAGNAASGTIASVAVPADAQLITLGVSGYSGVANILSGNGTFDLAGNTSVGIGGASNVNATQAALHYILNPATGTQNIDWQWGGGAGTTLAGTSVKVVIGFWKGVDTASPTRDGNGAQIVGATVATPTLTAQAGDLVIAMGGSNDDPTNLNIAFTWSGATEVRACTNRSDFDGSLATVSPTGNQTVGFTATNANEVAVAAFVFKASATGGPDLTVVLEEPSISITTF